MFYRKQNLPNVAYYADSMELLLEDHLIFIELQPEDYDLITILCMYKQIEEQYFDLRILTNLKKINFCDAELTTELIFDGELAIYYYKISNRIKNRDIVYFPKPVKLPEFYTPALIDDRYLEFKVINPMLIKTWADTKSARF